MHQNLDLKKNASGDPVGAQSDSKVAPKRPQNGDWGVHFGDFSCNRAILHPICYLLCFYHILQVSSGPFCDNFPEKMSAGHRPPAKSFSVSIFLRFLCKKVPKWGVKRRGHSSLICLFLIGLPLGSPGKLKAAITEPWGAKMLSQAPQIEVLGSKTAQKRTQ